MSQSESSVAKPILWGLAANIIVLGIVSFFTDVSSEMIFGPLLPLFLADVLGTRIALIGLVTGATEGAASLLNVVSGRLSDRIRRRKLFAVLGYGLSAAVKPLMYFGTSWGHVLGIRLVDRVGKGVRSSPRDALLAASTTERNRGRSFGFHRAMDTAGATLGLAIAALIVFAVQSQASALGRGSYQQIILISVVPAVLAVVVLYLFVHEPKRAAAAPARAAAAAPAEGLSTKFKVFLGIVALFTLGNSSDAFLSLRAQTLGTPAVNITIMFLVHNLAYTAVSMPAGALSDVLGRKRVLMLGWFIYAVSYLGFAVVATQWQTWLLFISYGVYYGFNEGVTKAFIADMVRSERRGSAYGIYHATVGVSLLVASLLAGFLWEVVSPAAPFYLGAGFSALAALALLALPR